MKKVKLMLVSFSVLAVVGAALAFNVKGRTAFCTADPVNNSCSNVACPNSKTGNLDDTQPFICTTPTTGTSGHDCDISGTTINCGATSVKYKLD